MDLLPYHDFSYRSTPLVSINRMLPQDDMGLHSHEFTELVVVTGGRGVHSTGRIEYEISARDVFVIEEGKVHGYRKSRNLQLLNIMYKAQLLEMEKTDVMNLPGYHALFRIEPGVQEDEGQAHLKIDLSRWRRLMTKIDQLESELAGEENGYQAYARSLLVEIIIEASRAYPGNQLTEGALTPRLAKVFTYLEESLHRRIRTPDLAEIANMSLSTLQRHFLCVTGETLTAYVNRLRIERSADLLRETDLAVTEIAFNVGFEDSNYFSKVFRRIKGTSPSQFRHS